MKEDHVIAIMAAILYGTGRVDVEVYRENNPASHWTYDMEDAVGDAKLLFKKITNPEGT